MLPTEFKALSDLYIQHCNSGTAIAPHLPYLVELSKDLTVLELGVKQGASSTAFLLSAVHVTSVDIKVTAGAQRLKEIVGDRWDYRVADSRTFGPCAADLLFIDSLHTYGQVKAELLQHASHARRYIVCHDTITFGSVGADGETGRQLWTYERGRSVPREAMGIRPSIDELMIQDPSWKLVAHYTHSHGLLVLERR